MHRRLWIVGVLAVVVGLGGCAQVKKQAFNRDAMGGLRTIAVAHPVDQDSYEAAVLGHPASSFGLVGGLIAAADIASKSSRLTAAIDPAETRLQDLFSQMLVERLNGVGYDASRVAVPKGSEDLDRAVDALRVKASGVDAVLVHQTVGAYWAAGAATPYVPRVLSRVRLFDAKTGAVLFEDTFTYGYSHPNAQTVHFSADGRHSYDDIGTLTADPASTREGLYAGLRAIAEQIAADLKR